MCGTPKGYGNWSMNVLKGKQDPEWDSFQFTTLDGGMVQKEIEQAKQDLDQRTFRQEFGTFENMLESIYNFHPVESVVEKL